MRFLAVVLSSLMLVACGGGQDSGFPLEVSGSAPSKAIKADIVPMTLTSSAFVDNGVIPDQFVYSYASQCTGSNWSPPLNIGNVPAGTAGLAVVVQDLDAGNLVHWKAWNIPVTTVALAANASTNATFSQSYNGLGSLGYGGPCPSSTTAPRYVFTLYALSKTFSSEPTLSDLGANALATAMLTGRRSSTDRLAWNATPGASFAGNGWYWDDKAGGTGMAFEAQGSSAFAGLFMYDAAGKAIWYVATGTFSIAATGYQFTGNLRQYAGGQALGGVWKMPTSVSVGTLNIAFTGNGNTTRAVVSLPGGRQWNTVRFNFNGLDAVNSGAQPESGWFWNATEGGRGYAIEVQNNQMFMAMFHYAADGSPTWQVVQNNMDSSGNITGADFRKYANGQTLTSAYVSPAAPVADGTVSTSFGNPCGGALTINALPSIQLQRYGFADLTSGAECRVRATANANGTPWANAGVSQSVTAGSTVTLDGSASSDPNGDALTYAWSLTSKPAGSAAALSSATSAKPTFTTDLAGTYVASLLVNDGKVNSTTVTVSVTARVANVAPVANAGAAQDVVAGSIVTLDSSASSDPNGDPLTYAWSLASKPAGSAAALSSASSVWPTFTADLAGTYVASLTVHDGKVSSTTVAVSVTAGVVSIPTITTAAATTTTTARTTSTTAAVRTTTTTTTTPTGWAGRPVANAGVAQDVVAGSVVTLNGSASSDPYYGNPLTYAWTLSSKPVGSAAVLSSATSTKPTFKADVAGTYLVSLIVNDGRLSSTPATVTISTITPIFSANCASCHITQAANAHIAANGGYLRGPCTVCHGVKKISYHHMYAMKPATRAVCGSCHTGIDFATGKGLTLADAARGLTVSVFGHLFGPANNDTLCDLCHTEAKNAATHSWIN